MTVADLDRLRAAARRGLELAARDAREDYLPHAVGNAARLTLGTAVTALMLGLEEEARPAIERCHRWLLDSVARGESFGDPPEYFAMRRQEALALATGLVGEPSAQMFGEAARLQRQAVDDLPGLVRDCLSAGMYELGVAAYARHAAGRPPPEGAEVDTPLQLAAWLCQELAAGRPPAAWLAVGTRVLRDRIADWATRGQGLAAAAWLKVVFWDSGATLSPAETLRRGGELLGAVEPSPLAGVLLDSLGDPVDVDLFGGFLAATGAALLRAGHAAVDDPPPPGTLLVAEFAGRPLLVVPVAAAVVLTGLDEAVTAALFQEAARLGGGAPPRKVRLRRLLDSIAAAARGRVVDADGPTLLALRQVAARPADAGEPADDDWRDRVVALVTAGRLRLPELAALASRTVVPPTSVGLRDDDRRVLLALRDLAAARARGVPLDRPVHSDAGVASARAAVLRDIETVLDGGPLPSPESPAYVLAAVLDPARVRRSGSAPPEWRAWLDQG
jgi:hypothetical protein